MEEARFGQATQLVTDRNKERLVNLFLYKKLIYVKRGG